MYLSKILLACLAVSATVGLASPAKGETTVSNNVSNIASDVAKNIVDNVDNTVGQTELATNPDNPVILAVLPQVSTELESGVINSGVINLGVINSGVINNEVRNLESFPSQEAPVENLHDSDYSQALAADNSLQNLQNIAVESQFSTGEATPTTLEFSQGFSQGRSPQIVQPLLGIRADMTISTPVPEIADQNLASSSNLSNSSLPPTALLLALGERGRLLDRPLQNPAQNSAQNSVQNLDQNSLSANSANPNNQTLLAQTPATPTTPTTPTTPVAPVVPETQVLVAELVVSGAGDLENRVYEVIRTQPGRTTTRSQLQEDVNAIAATGFFNNVEVIPADTPLGVRLTFVVNLNPVLRRVVVQPLPATPQSGIFPPALVEEIFSPQYGSILNTRQLQTGVGRINQWYRDNGYTLAQVIQPQIGEDGTVTLNVAEGVIEDIQVRFLNLDNEATNEDGTPVTGRTRDFIITREVQLKAGDVFNRRIAEADLQRLFGLGIFNDVRASFRPGQDPRQVILVLEVVERNTGTVTAGGGFSSSSGLFGSVGYQEQNLGGNNQRIGAEVQVGQRELLFDFQFSDPWIAGDPYRTAYNVNAFRSRSVSLIFDGGTNPITFGNGEIPRIVRYGAGVTFTRPLSDNVFARAEWVASLGFQYQNVSVQDDSGRTRARQRGNPLSASGSGVDDLFSIQLGLARDTRDNPLAPTSGSVLRLGIDQTVPVGSGSIFFNRLRANYSYYLPVRFTNFTEGPQVLALNLQGGTVLGDLPPYEAFSTGGTNSVRGYNEGDVGSSRSYALASLEYRFPVFSIIGGALFVDAASDLGTGRSVPGDPAGLRGKPGSGFGYGVGIRVQSPVGAIRIDYGLNDRGDNRIHFGIGERF